MSAITMGGQVPFWERFRASMVAKVPFLSKMDRYLLKEMLLPFCFWLLAWLTVLTGHFLYWVLRETESIPLKELFFYMLYKIPFALGMGIPISTLFMTGVVINRFGREGELMALRIGGVSNFRIVLPFLLFSLAVSAGDFCLNEKLTPWANHRAEEIKRKLFLRQPANFIQEDKYFKVGNYYFYIRRVDPKTSTLHGVMIYEKSSDGSGFPRVQVAKYAKKVGDVWMLYDVVIHEYDDKGRQRYEMKVKEQRINLKGNIDAFWAEQRTPAEMAAWELKEQIDLFDKSGYDVHAMKIDYYFKFALPSACFIMALWAAPLALRFAHRGGYAGLVIAILGVFLYQGMMCWFQEFGIEYRLSPFLSAWAQNFIFGGFGLYLLLKER